MKKVIIIGGGAAGMMAAVFAARDGHQVSLYEKNEKLGKKLFITGKGRCNITNDSDTETLLNHVVTNKKFLYSSFYSFDSYSVTQFFEDLGLSLKTERGGRVFPCSDHSSDVIRTLETELKRLKVNIHLNTEVNSLVIENQICTGINLRNGRKIPADKVITATGGISYPSTGSDGDGYRFAKEAGHQVTPLYPSLVPLEVKEEYCHRLQGLTLKNVSITMRTGKKELYSDFGEMLFTHYGVTGPLILSASSHIIKLLDKQPVTMELDLKPALTPEQLDKRLLKDFHDNINKDFKNALDKLLPVKMIPVIIELSKIPEHKKINEISKKEREHLIHLLKHMPFTITKGRGYKEAVITKGGVHIKEIDPGTMESKLVKNLFFIGEVLDLDALTGGFNLQIAWSTAYSAGSQLS